MDTAKQPDGPLPDPLREEWEVARKGVRRVDPQGYFEACGIPFDGTEWMQLVPALEPLEETAAAIAINPDLLDATVEQPPRLTTRFSGTSVGPILDFALVLSTAEGSTATYRTALNPASPTLRSELLHSLSEQDFLPLDFYDADTGDHLGRRTMPLDSETKDLIRTALKEAAEMPADTEAWPWAVLKALGITVRF